MITKSQMTRSGRSRLVALIAGGALAFGVVLPASADHGHDRGYSQYRKYDDDDFRPRGHRYGHYKHHKRKTVHVYHHYHPRPVERVRVEHHYYPAPEPRTVYVEPRYRETPYGGAYHAGAGPSGGALIGAAVGGLLGSKAGKGNGKLAATAAGTLAGFLIGGDY